MKRKSPISVDRIQFYTYDRKQIDELNYINKFPYDDRHDFLVGRCLGGIAVKTEVSNNRYDKGARRNVSFSLVDMTKRCEAAKQQVRISLSKDDFKDCYIYFPAETSGACRRGIPTNLWYATRLPLKRSPRALSIYSTNRRWAIRKNGMKFPMEEFAPAGMTIFSNLLILLTSTTIGCNSMLPPKWTADFRP